jgi:hypothetical protein
LTVIDEGGLMGIVNNNKNMKKTILILTCALGASASAKAEFINFESDSNSPNPFKADGFSSVGHPNVQFSDTLHTSSQTSWLKIVGNNVSQGVGLGTSHAIDTKALWVQGTDTSALKMSFSTYVDSISFWFANDQEAGNYGRLQLFDAAGGLVSTVYSQGDFNTATFESISYSGAWFKTALFDMGTVQINLPAFNTEVPPSQFFTFTTGPVQENVDNITFRPVPEVQTYASLFGAALVGVECLRRRRRA